MRELFLILIFLAVTSIKVSSTNIASHQIKGRIIDQTDEKALEFVNVVLLTKNDSTVMFFSVTDQNGRFVLDKVPVGDFTVKCSFIGYSDTKVSCKIDAQSPAIIQLGTIGLNQVDKQLNEVMVRSEKAIFNNSIDRKVFNIEKDLLSQSGSVSDLLQNIPSVIVDLEGNISLRGSDNVTVLVDGKPSMLMGKNKAAILQQMPANSIKSIEIITNPSAKYKPDGTAGIINIVRKKNTQTGTNGNLIANYGNENRANANLTLNYNPGKINIFGSYGIRHDDRQRKRTEDRTLTDSLTRTVSYFRQNDLEFASPLVNTTKAGFDWDVTEETKIGASLDYFHNSFTRTQKVGNYYEDSNHQLTKNFDRDRIDYEYERELEFTATLQHQFEKEDHELNIEFTYGKAHEQEDNRYTDVYYLPVIPKSFDNTLIIQSEKKSQLYVEYVYPITDNSRIEAGYVGEYGSKDLDFRGEYLDPTTNSWKKDVEKTNEFILDENVHALYATYGQTFGKFSALAGFRTEQAYVKSNLVNLGASIPNNYFRLYPSLHLDYKLSEESEFQVNYSHRIRRPEDDQLNPFSEYQDPLNIRAGNPKLKPEDIHSIETGYKYQNDKFTFMPTLYYRYKYNGFSQITKLINDSILLTTSTNLSKDQSAGMELIFSFQLAKFWSANLSSNFFYNKIDASNLGLSKKKEIVSMTTQFSTNLNITKKTLFQLNGNYRAARLTPQGKVFPSFVMNAGIREDIFKKKASVIFTISDIFKSLVEKTEFDTPWMYRLVNRTRTTRIFYIGFVYRFGENSTKANNKIEFDNSI